MIDREAMHLQICLSQQYFFLLSTQIHTHLHCWSWWVELMNMRRYPPLFIPNEWSKSELWDYIHCVCVCIHDTGAARRGRKYGFFFYSVNPLKTNEYKIEMQILNILCCIFQKTILVNFCLLPVWNRQTQVFGASLASACLRRGRLICCLSPPLPCPLLLFLPFVKKVGRLFINQKDSFFCHIYEPNQVFNPK